MVARVIAFVLPVLLVALLIAYQFRRSTALRATIVVVAVLCVVVFSFVFGTHNGGVSHSR